VFVVAGLVVFHSAVVFASGTSWFVKDPESSDGFTVFLVWGSPWEMPLLFVVSGMGVRQAMRTRSAGGFVRERLARLLVPFVVGLAVLVPPMFCSPPGRPADGYGLYAQFLRKTFWTLSVWRPKTVSASRDWLEPHLSVMRDIHPLMATPGLRAVARKGRGATGEQRIAAQPLDGASRDG
jgi:hypothetical protein